MFNKKIMILAMLTAVASTPVFAQNTITFNGKIYDQACTVQVNGSTDTTIDLGNYSKERIAEKGATTDYVPFTVSLVSCRKQELAYQPRPCSASTAQQMIPTQRTSKTRTKDRKRAPRVSVFLFRTLHIAM